jgi:hypothetical protein
MVRAKLDSDAKPTHTCATTHATYEAKPAYATLIENVTDRNVVALNDTLKRHHLDKGQVKNKQGHGQSKQGCLPGHGGRQEIKQGQGQSAQGHVEK